MVAAAAALLCGTTFAADRYWVGTNSVNWNSTANWSTNSGGACGFSVPGSSDKAIFDGNSSNCTVNTGFNPDISALDMQAGFAKTLDLNGQNFTVEYGNFVQAGGTLNCSTGTVTVKSSLTISGGTFNSGTGTFVFDCPYNTTQTITPGSAVLTNVTLLTHGGSGVGIFLISGTLDVNGNLRFESVTADRTCRVDGGTIKVAGDVRMTTANFGGGGTAVVELDGTGDQTIYGDAAGYFPNVKVNKAGVPFTLAEQSLSRVTGLG